MSRILTLALLLLAFAASAQTTAPTDNPRIGLGRLASNGSLTAGLNAKPTPLYIVDGHLLEASRLPEISPDQIESIAVVKGSKALALYGEKGRDGLVLITTKAVAGAK